MGMLGVAFLLNACQDQGLKPEALGSVAEVLVVSEAEIWQGEIGRQLRKTLSSEQYGLPQPEPWFKLIPVQDLGSNKFQSRHRFMLHIRIGDPLEDLPKNVVMAAKKAIEQSKVYWGMLAHPRAFPQREVWFIAPDSSVFVNFLREQGPWIRQQFQRMDKELILERLNRLTSSDTVLTMIRDNIGIQMPHLPGDYRVKRILPGRIWLSKEIPQGSMNLFLWKDNLPKGESSASAKKAANFIQMARDSVLAKGIPGPSPGSQYRTEFLLTPLWGQDGQTHEGRGMWKMEGDFMGGPFVHRAWFGKGVAYHAEAFVYAPNEPKRAWLRELEALLASMALVGNSK